MCTWAGIIEISNPGQSLVSVIPAQTSSIPPTLDPIVTKSARLVKEVDTNGEVRSWFETIDKQTVKERRFQWDENKNKINLEKHGIDFQEAKLIFDDEKKVVGEDNRKDYGETRYIRVGQFSSQTQNKNLTLVVVYTERDGEIRIISARKANKKEKKQYESS